ncbi:MAG: di-trans,poly-cis-decaprenylcistransferase, partial [Deltaproteobacteria bacterium]
EKLRALVKASSKNRSMTLALALSYGSREEILRAARRLVGSAARGKLRAGQVTERLFESMLYTAEIPDPDLIIRTGGEKRLSNFLLWQAAYTELVFVRKLWPDFTEEDLHRAFREYRRRCRRFGLTDEQRKAGK